MTTTVEPAEIPVLDRACLDDLASDLASPADARDFAASFVKLLPGRIHSIAAALDGGRTEAAHVSLVSLAVSASMVGALRLEREARLLDGEVLAGRAALAAESVRRLVDDADAACAALVEAVGVVGWP
ncbi:hypothetical protein [Sinomonas mesophila]|uniref:hypothetical protein n=1 Tax=Sinomonas mesophila TaxID=1531955 RepID=UPI000984FBAA|nr:hypothetical protein [Sinomonas mesophila]